MFLNLLGVNHHGIAMFIHNYASMLTALILFGIQNQTPAITSILTIIIPYCIIPKVVTKIVNQNKKKYTNATHHD